MQTIQVCLIMIPDHEDNYCLANEVNLRICILSTNYKSLKVDNDEEREYPLILIGHILNEENFNGSLFNVNNKNEVSVNIRNNDSIPSKSFNIQLEQGISSSYFHKLSYNLIIVNYLFLLYSI